MPMTLIVVAITAVVSYLAWQKPALMSRLILWPPAVNRSKQYDRLVTYGFIHADGMHLFFNMFTLYFFGRVVEQLFGTLGFVAFYLAALVVSILPSYLSHRDDANYRSLGASGAVSACLFAFIVVAPWDKIYLYGALGIPAIIYAVLYVAYSIWMDRRGRDN
ncbi:MAG: rhomboid family intramembrane serine protease, partial [Proteobacteria bacterium]|nr:rhomboid family intramembrane serine protease [Pseudomonadota bacterium]